jgi:hypothetical protein
MASNNLGRSVLAMLVVTVTAGVMGTGSGAATAWAAPGSAGDPVSPSAGTIKAGTSIGTVGDPLQGDTLYKGKIATTSTDAWYQLYKAAGSGTATIHFKDTTVAGSATCPDIAIHVDNADGTDGNVDSTSLGDNDAVTFSVTTAGQYYIELDSYNCGTGNAGATYSIEPEPSSEWTAAPVPSGGRGSRGRAVPGRS